MTPGIDRLIAEISQYGLAGQRTGLITNQSGLSVTGEHTIDLLYRHTTLTRLFAPEHGIRGELQAGVHFGDSVDAMTGVHVVSLYGDNRKPKPETLEGLDALIFDIQDAGARFYTYLYTMAYAMEACAAKGLPMFVLDRPNPINAETVEGGLLNPQFSSFVGLYPVPYRYGLTIGEMALLFNKEFSINCDLTVVPMTGYSRSMWYGETGLVWVLPSANLPEPESCLIFSGSCVFEGTNVSEGRGTVKPFRFIGAPFINGSALAERMNSENHPGVFFRPHSFTPTFSKHQGSLCHGVEIHITDKNAIRPVTVGFSLLYAIREMFPEFAFLPPRYEGSRYFIDLLTGSDTVRLGKMRLEGLLSLYQQDSAAFAGMKELYHLYK